MLPYIAYMDPMGYIICLFPNKNILNLWVYIPNVQTKKKHRRNRVLPGQFDKCDLRADLESRLY